MRPAFPYFKPVYLPRTAFLALRTAYEFIFYLQSDNDAFCIMPKKSTMKTIAFSVLLFAIDRFNILYFYSFIHEHMSVICICEASAWQIKKVFQLICDILCIQLLKIMLNVKLLYQITIRIFGVHLFDEWKASHKTRNTTCQSKLCSL